jgi:hypothetical protein
MLLFPHELLSTGKTQRHAVAGSGYVIHRA